ncbi:MAG TPA: hypothetical protein VJV78_47885 [Polyangiales bacterium]|nr:hypothetical protein [Polyangiales bacterium]
MSEHTLDGQRFARMWRALGAKDATAFEAIAAAYRSEGRAYHDCEHIRECLAYFDRVRDRAQQPDHVEAAIWFHDVVYDTSKHDNEASSADLASELASSAGIAPADAEVIAALVLCTKHDAPAPGHDAELLRDVDLSILGASPERYARYERDIRREYAAVPEDLYRQARRHVLGKFLERLAIYQTPYFYERLESQARENLARAIAAL